MKHPEARDFRIQGLWVMVFNATLNHISVISWRWVLLVEETGVSGENHRPDCIGSCKSNYHTITTTTAPFSNTGAIMIYISTKTMIKQNISLFSPYKMLLINTIANISHRPINKLMCF